MTISRFLDLKLEKGTDDIIFFDINNNKLLQIDYEKYKVKTVKYQKIAIISVYI